LTPEVGTNKLTKKSVRNYHYSLRNSPEERSFRLLCWRKAEITEQKNLSIKNARNFLNTAGTIRPAKRTMVHAVA
jgi:hypothetical protein